jgi:predicted nucleic acid-binding protein
LVAAVLVDTGFLVAFLGRHDSRHAWAVAAACKYPPPWQTCDGVLTETFHLLGGPGRPSLTELLHLGSLVSSFSLSMDVESILMLMQKYSDVPMSFADACLVRMTEVVANSMLLATDSDFRVYRRHDRQVIPCTLPA